MDSKFFKYNPSNLYSKATLMTPEINRAVNVMIYGVKLLHVDFLGTLGTFCGASPKNSKNFISKKLTLSQLILVFLCIKATKMDKITVLIFIEASSALHMAFLNSLGSIF